MKKEIYNYFTKDSIITLYPENEGCISIEDYLIDGKDDINLLISSYDRFNGVVVPEKVLKIEKIKTTWNLVKVNLETGDSFVCTPETMVLLETGDFMCVKDIDITWNRLRLTGRDKTTRIRSIESVTLDSRKEVYSVFVGEECNFELSCGIFIKSSKV